MKMLARFLFALCIAAGAVVTTAPAHAETLRCNGQSAGEGESRISVLRKCGQPQLQDSYCAPVYYPQALEPLPGWYARSVAPCLPVEEWYYDRGPGNLSATVRFRSGVVQSISYGQAPP
jgi:hypothetical protein